MLQRLTACFQKPLQLDDAIPLLLDLLLPRRSRILAISAMQSHLFAKPSVVEHCEVVLIAPPRKIPGRCRLLKLPSQLRHFCLPAAGSLAAGLRHSDHHAKVLGNLIELLPWGLVG
jgi:hypothetical protein